MEVLFKNRYTEIFFDARKDILIQVTYPETKYMSDYEFKDMLLVWKAAWSIVKSRYSLSDFRNQLFPVNKELEEWAAINIHSRVQLEKAAFIVSEESVNNPEMMQYTLHIIDVWYGTRFFDSILDAEKWLLS